MKGDIEVVSDEKSPCLELCVAFFFRFAETKVDIHAAERVKFKMATDRKNNNNVTELPMHRRYEFE